jgi:hypothetical protein
MSGTATRPMQEPDITWTMPLSIARTVLSIVAKQPYEQVSGIIRMLEEQGNQQLQQFEAQQQPRGNGEDSPHRQLPS